MARFQRPSEYHKLSVAEKQAVAQERLVEPPLSCPRDCGTRVMPADLPQHVAERCPGPKPPGPGSMWVDHAQALKLGVDRVTLHRWVQRGEVRRIGARGDGKYLLRDLVQRVAVRRPGHRR